MLPQKILMLKESQKMKVGIVNSVLIEKPAM
jgi:hypothetical protein